MIRVRAIFQNREDKAYGCGRERQEPRITPRASDGRNRGILAHSADRQKDLEERDLAAQTKNSVRALYAFPGAAITNYHKLGGLKQQKFIFLKFWRPEVSNTDVGRAMLPPEALRKKLFLASSGF